MDSRQPHDTRQTILTLWHYGPWHCVFEPVSDAFGRLVVYSGDLPVLEMPKVSYNDARGRARGLRALTDFATARLDTRRQAAERDETT